MPSCHYFTEKALPALHKKISDTLRVLLSDVPHVSFTTDIWSSSMAPMSPLSLTAQWIESSFALRHATLHAQESRGSHTAERIQQAMENMLINWGTDKQRVHIILRGKYEESSEGCGGAESGLRGPLLHEGLLSQCSVTETLANASKIVGHFKHSPLAYSRLEDIQTELHMDTKRLQQDVPTRWNSSLYMLQSRLEQKCALGAFAAELSALYQLHCQLTSGS
ncbi:mannose-P-dolichol utilization defect 1a isoform X3 [Neoarius graeffei]|uniref:mannose-P-dolichol utilization defect 1a isoform X3 n=1 Tax=Neoarius graeffei TaxID=443677 RepID=UPI00298D1B9A|nr:mannose-P-dolichol utilization defect 1a isoform X3 [Neoarius graeffei]